jgi:hypothetical protein
MSSTTYILAINCGSSSIKAKLYALNDSAKRQPLTAVAEGSIKGIAAKGQKIKIKLEWLDGSGHDVSEEGELGDQVDCTSEVSIWDSFLKLSNLCVIIRSNTSTIVVGKVYKLFQGYQRRADQIHLASNVSVILLKADIASKTMLTA